MSIFGKIMSSIFGKASAAGAAPASGAKPSSAAGSITEVDVAAIVTKLAVAKRKKKKVTAQVRRPRCELAIDFSRPRKRFSIQESNDS